MDTDININKLTYQINGAIFEVSRTLGAGFLEKVYENALMIELLKRELKAESQVPIKVSYKDTIVGEYFADILVQDKVILELKAAENLSKLKGRWKKESQCLEMILISRRKTQMDADMKATEIQIDLMVNFKHPKAEIKRMVPGLKE